MPRERADAQRAAGATSRSPGLPPKDDAGHAYAAFSTDAGRTFGDPDSPRRRRRSAGSTSSSSPTARRWRRGSSSPASTRFSVAAGAPIREPRRPSSTWRRSPARGPAATRGRRARATRWYSRGRKAPTARCASERRAPARLRRRPVHRPVRIFFFRFRLTYRAQSIPSCDRTSYPQTRRRDNGTPTVRQARPTR